MSQRTALLSVLLVCLSALAAAAEGYRVETQELGLWPADVYQWGTMGGWGHYAVFVGKGDGRFAMRYDGRTYDLWPGRMLRNTPDGGRFAWLRYYSEDEKWELYIDGQLAPVQGRFSPFTPFLFDSTGERYAYVVGEEGGMSVVVDGEQGPEFDRVRVPGQPEGPEVFFAPDSKHYAYTASRGERWHMVVDGIRGPAWTAIGGPIFSSDGNTLIYWVFRGEDEGDEEQERSVVLVDLDSGEANWIPNAGLPRLTATGKLVYVRHSEIGQRVVVEDEAGPTHRSISHLMVAPTRDRIAYAVEATPLAKAENVMRIRGSQVEFGIESMGEEAQRLVVDGQEGPIHETRSLGLCYSFGDAEGTCFSPDGEHVAYSFRRDGVEWVVADGEQLGPYAEVGYLGFSEDSSTLAFLARKSIFEGGQWVIVINGEEQPGRFSSIWDFKLNADGSRHAFIMSGADTDGPVTVVVDGREYAVSAPAPSDPAASRVWFSPDGTQVAVALTPLGERGWRLVPNGWDGPLMGPVLGRPVFDDDGSVEFMAFAEPLDGSDARYRPIARVRLVPDGP